MTINLINEKDVHKPACGKYTRNKRCYKCDTKDINIELTELVRINGRLRQQYSCDKCDIRQ
jgi:hypothetical protein